MSPVFSVALPVLNGMPYLTEALASLEAQTFRDFSVVLWDNGSTDGTLEEARRWIPSRLPGRVVSGDALPLHLCLARMVEEARTDLIARMDADDVCLPDRFRSQLDFLRDHPRCVLVGGQMEWIGPDGASIGHDTRYAESFAEILFAFLFVNPIAHPTVMFRREAVLAAGGYAVPKPVEDYDLWMRLARQGELRNLPGRLLRYRRHPGAVCGNDKGNSLDSAMIAAAEARLPQLLGIDRSTYTRLRAKRHACAALALLPVLQQVGRRTGTRISSLLRSPEVLYIARCLTAHRDRFSRLVWRVVEGMGHLKSETWNEKS